MSFIHDIQMIMNSSQFDIKQVKSCHKKSISDPGIRRESYSPGFSRTRHKSDATDDIKPSPSPCPRLSGQYIPVFALNTRGSYYVPLSVDSSHLEQFMPLLTESTSGPYHPITISVKFSSLFTAPAPTLGPMFADGAGAAEAGVIFRNSGRSGVIQSSQSVIKNWRDQAP